MNKYENKPYDLHSLTILVVEEYPFMARILESMLKAFNVGRITWTCKIKEAMEYMKSQSFEFIIIDWMPPSGVGLQLIEWVRNNPTKSIQFMPVLFLTSNAQSNVVFSARDRGCTEIMVKPLSAKKLAGRLLHIIDYPRPHILAPAFKGPDRRRKDKAVEIEKRTMTIDELEIIFEKK